MTAIEQTPPLARRLQAASLPWYNIGQWAIFVAVVVVVMMPLLFLVLGSFSKADHPADFSFSELTLKNYADVWLDPGVRAVFWNTLIYVTGSALFGISTAFMLAWLTERTDMPGKVWIYAAVPMSLAMPGMLSAMAWVFLASPRIGLINKWIEPVGLGPISIYSLGGMIFVEGLRLVPTGFLMLVPLLRSMDPGLEEAARMSGAGSSPTLRKVTMPLLMPGILAVVIYQAMTALEVFEVPGILGLPAGIYVFSTKIYVTLHTASAVPKYGEASALAMLYLVIAVFATALYARVVMKAERFSVVTGKAYRPRIEPLGRWKPLAIAGVLLYLLFAVILPFLVFLYVSFLPFLQMPSRAAFASMTLINYSKLFATPAMGPVLWNTFVLMMATGISVVVVSFFVSLVVVRTRFALRRLLDQLAFMPHAVPGIVLGLAFLWLFLEIDVAGIPIHGGLLALTIAATVSYMSYGTRTMNAAILQIHKELEEAAHTSGAAGWQTLMRVFFPLLLPAFAGLFIWVVVHVVRTAGMPLILLEGKDSMVLAVLIWNMWDEGLIEGVAAIGTLLMIFLMAVALLLGRFGMTRASRL